MFKLQTIESVRWPVEVRIPRDGGKATKATFYCTFRVMEKRDIDEASRDSADDAEFLARVVTDWEGVADENDSPLPFTPDNLARLTGRAYVRVAMLNAFHRAQLGATEKN